MTIRPARLQLATTGPNPVRNRRTSFRPAAHTEQAVTVTLHDVLGRTVRPVYEGRVGSDGRDLSVSGRRPFDGPVLRARSGVFGDRYPSHYRGPVGSSSTRPLGSTGRSTTAVSPLSCGGPLRAQVGRLPPGAVDRLRSVVFNRRVEPDVEEEERVWAWAIDGTNRVHG